MTVWGNTSEEVCSKRDASAVLVVCKFQTVLGLSFAPEKAFVIASSKALVDKAQTIIKVICPHAGNVIRRFGVDDHLSPQKTKESDKIPVHRQRFLKAREKFQRLEKMG